MKAMSQTMYLVVAALVIMVTAIVVIAIFVPSIAIVPSLFQAKAMCQTDASVACASFGHLPTTWNVQNIKYTDSSGKESQISCAQVMDQEDVVCGCNNNALECKAKSSTQTPSGDGLPII